jgi:hypothetical protein
MTFRWTATSAIFQNENQFRDCIFCISSGRTEESERFQKNAQVIALRTLLISALILKILFQDIGGISEAYFRNNIQL